MDEIDFKRTYNEVVTAAAKITAPETRNAVMLILQLVVGLDERITEMQEEEDE